MSIEENLSMAAMSIDSAYNFEVDYLGYPAPPSDNGMGGDNLYDIYIINLGGGLYGYTESEDDLGGQKYTSFMVVDNDYAGYYSTGINGARVTLAHEFHHSIQMGNYILRFDYTFYMSHYFNNTGKLFSQFIPLSSDGYDLAIWNLYIKENFDFSIIKRQW